MPSSGPAESASFVPSKSPSPSSAGEPHAAPWETENVLDTGTQLPRIPGTVLPDTTDFRVLGAAVVDLMLKRDYTAADQPTRDQIRDSILAVGAKGPVGEVSAAEVENSVKYSAEFVAGKPEQWDESVQAGSVLSYETKRLGQHEGVPELPIIAVIALNNPASISLAERLGFARDNSWDVEPGSGVWIYQH